MQKRIFIAGCLWCAQVQAGALGAIGDVTTDPSGAVMVQGWMCTPTHTPAQELVLAASSKPDAVQTQSMLAVIRAQRLKRQLDHKVCASEMLYQSFNWRINPVEAAGFAGQEIIATATFSDGETLLLAGSFVLDEPTSVQTQSITTFSQIPYGVTFVHQDILGSVIAETNGNQSVTLQSQYRPFGKSEDY
ncbi:hypothetical protein ACFOD1_09080 [Pseudidiomarina halophila]|uniref:Uncharacterized protein n=1 Tax=Pseudidiomarina halophila TaxID=1449799 RepID=A0A432Y1D5_9GAMM|nr:hypothetical protein [Pseudidiomarina halophila]RUO54751.1 hypothetical protein CWI69_04920 [Pseudidiomarina halophila]